MKSDIHESENVEMSNVRHICTRELLPDARMPSELMGSGLARSLPRCLRERKLNLGEMDKVFASQWLSENEVIVGTKCNKVGWGQAVGSRVRRIIAGSGSVRGMQNDPAVFD